MSSGNIAQLRKSLAGFWPQIEAAAAKRENVAGAWERVRTTAEANGIGIPPGGIQEMNRLYSIAASMRRSGEEVARAGDSSVILPEMIGRYWTSGPNAGIGETQRWMVRFEANTGTADEPNWEWLTRAKPGQLEPTIGDLRDALMLYGNRMTETPTGPVLEVRTIQIAAI